VSGPGGSPTQTSWFWKSDDKGIQWHSVGCIPIGKPNCQNGGGDTEIAIARNNDVFASDLQTLQCNSTFRSYDEGKTFDPGEGCTQFSADGGATWVARPSPGAQGNFFANIALDTAGNLWQGWTTGCSNPGTTPCKAFVSYSTDEGQTWHTPIQVNTGAGSP